MPGVLMLEALTQAGAWLIRELEDFAHSVIILKQAKTIKYGSFVEPGRQLELRVELTSYDARDCVFKGVGAIDGQEMVKGRFTLTRYNLRDRDPGAARDRCLDRRGLSRSLHDLAKGLRRCARHRAAAGGLGIADHGLTGRRIAGAMLAPQGCSASRSGSRSDRLWPP